MANARPPILPTHLYASKYSCQAFGSDRRVQREPASVPVLRSGIASPELLAPLLTVRERCHQLKAGSRAEWILLNYVKALRCIYVVFEAILGWFNFPMVKR